MLSERADLQWAAQQILLILPRQNGKNAILEALELAAIFLFGEMRIIHSAHLNKTAGDHMKRMRALVRASPELDEITRFYETNGKERMVRLDTGAQIEFMTRGQKTARGGSPDRVVFDEALFLTNEQVQAIVPSMSAQSMNEEGAPQFIYTSSAPLQVSDVLHRIRKRAVAGGISRMFYAEWGIELPDNGIEGIDLTDVDLWYQANPGMGIRISEEWVHDNELSVLTDEALAIERLGVVFPVVETQRDVKIPSGPWSATITNDSPSIKPGDVTIAYDVSIDGLWSSIAIGTRTILDPYVELIEHRQGVGWLPERLVELIRRWEPKAVGANGAGPAAAQLAAILTAFQQADPPISADILTLLNTAAYTAACQGIYTDIIEGRLQRPPGQGPLDAAAGDATERKIGDGFGWHLRQATIPISPLGAITVARALLPVEAEPDAEPLFAFTN